MSYVNSLKAAPLGKNGHLLAKLSALQSVGANELFLVKLELADHVVHLHLLAVPVLLLGKESVVLHSQTTEVVLQLADLLCPALLFLFKLFSVLLLALP
jgi:hypothetical protein